MARLPLWRSRIQAAGQSADSLRDEFPTIPVASFGLPGEHDGAAYGGPSDIEGTPPPATRRSRVLAIARYG